mmetsp:Transcript_28765/g.73598  ORF Transcript_28765/g.73598 Transcript_28765/m.73598 type:complete len:102 (+) Transcript_28765:1335-1640(+)
MPAMFLLAPLCMSACKQKRRERQQARAQAQLERWRGRREEEKKHEVEKEESEKAAKKRAAASLSPALREKARRDADEFRKKKETSMKVAEERRKEMEGWRR